MILGLFLISLVSQFQFSFFKPKDAYAKHKAQHGMHLYPLWARSRHTLEAGRRNQAFLLPIMQDVWRKEPKGSLDGSALLLNLKWTVLKMDPLYIPDYENIGRGSFGEVNCKAKGCLLIPNSISVSIMSAAFLLV